jgi:hypothetical protein
MGQVNLPVTRHSARVMQPYRECATFEAWHDNVGVTTVERPDPNDLSTLVSAWSYSHAGGLYACPPDLELGALTKWLASRMLV